MEYIKIDKKVKVLKALADPLRIGIVKILNCEEEICVLRDKFDVKQSNLSQHLNILKEADILDTRKDAAWVF